MLKINKYLGLTRSFPQLGYFRNVCHDSYECKKPPQPDEVDMIELAKENKRHPLFIPHENKLKKAKLYRNIFLIICVPVLLCGFLNFLASTDEHRKRAKFVEFSYLRIRRKPFPWDPERSLFHNPRYNALPGGYEFEVPEDEEFDPFDNWRD